MNLLGTTTLLRLQAHYDRLLARHNELVTRGDTLAVEAGRMAAEDPFRDRTRLVRAVKDWWTAR